MDFAQLLCPSAGYLKILPMKWMWKVAALVQLFLTNSFFFSNSFLILNSDPREEVHHRNKFLGPRLSKTMTRWVANTSQDNLVKCRLGWSRSESSVSWTQYYTGKTGLHTNTNREVSIWQYAGWAYGLRALPPQTSFHYTIFQRINVINFLLRSFSSFWEVNRSIMERFWN